MWRKTRSPNAFRTEPAELTGLVLESAGDLVDAGFAKFVRYRYQRPFQHSVAWSMRYSFAFTTITVLIIGAGVTSSVLAGLSGHGSDTLIAVLGVFVAIAASVNRLWRPGPRAALRHRTANALRREGWSFVCKQGRYAVDVEADRLKIFFAEVERINMPAEAIDEQELEGGSE